MLPCAQITFAIYTDEPDVTLTRVIDADMSGVLGAVFEEAEEQVCFETRGG